MNLRFHHVRNDCSIQTRQTLSKQVTGELNNSGQAIGDLLE